MKAEKSSYVFFVVSAVVVTLLAVACVLPFIFMLSGSFSDNTEILANGYSLLPKKFSLYAYTTIFEQPGTILRAYGISFFVTGVGTLLGVFLVSMTGYVLSRPDFKYANKVSLFLYFTTIFSGGTIPWYIMLTQVLHLKDTIFALIIPLCMNAFNIFLFKNFMKGVPHDLVESARIDGAGEFSIYWKIMLPLAKPAVATIALFMALAYWNDWFHASLLISDSSMYPLQYVLFKMTSQVTSLVDTSVVREQALPTETIKLAMAVIAAVPVFIFYPFAQKYFVTGLVIGGVKG